MQFIYWTRFISLVPLLISCSCLHAALSIPLDIVSMEQIASHQQKNKPVEFSQQVLFRVGHGRNNVVQGVTYDENRQFLYTLQLTGKDKKGVLNRFAYSESTSIKAIDHQHPSNLIGHQGITVDPRNGMLWTTTHASKKNAGWMITGFHYQANGLPNKVSNVQVFDQTYSKTAYTLPTITPDARFLIVRGRKENKNIIRVFDLTKNLLSDGENISQSYLYEWPIDSALTKNKFAFQAMTSDGKYVYLFSGGLGTQGQENKRLYVYTIQGKLVQKTDQLTVGKLDSLAFGKEGHWEPEGLAIDAKTKKLLMMYAIGDKGQRLAKIYKIPIQY